MTRVVLAFLLLCGLVACTDRHALVQDRDERVIAREVDVLVATTRAPTDAGWFGGERSSRARYIDLSIGIPRDHTPGQSGLSLFRPNPLRDFAVMERSDIDGRAAFRQALRKRIASAPGGSRDVILFIHGYNNSFSGGLFRTAQLMNDFELPGVPVHFSWPSAANPLGYTHDRDSVLIARDDLEDLMRDISAAGPGRIVLVAHSMGAMLSMETLRQIDIRSPGWARKAMGGVILISPDLNVDLFKSQADRIAALPEPFAIFVSKRDRVLALSARINGDTDRLGSVTDARTLADYPVTLIDVTAFSPGASIGHFTLGTSPALIALLSRSLDLTSTFRRDPAGRTGLLPGTVLTVQEATQLILSPHLLQAQ